MAYFLLGSKIIFKDIFLFTCLHRVLVMACGIYLSDLELNQGPLHWEHGALATAAAGKFSEIVFNTITSFILFFVTFFVKSVPTSYFASLLWSL